MGVFRYLLSFLAGTLIVLTMLVAALMFFDHRTAGPHAEPAAFTVEYLSPEQGARLLGKPRRTRTSPGDPVTDTDQSSQFPESQ